MFELIATNEILGSMVPSASASERDTVVKSLDAEVVFVVNTDSAMNLTLPYYSGVEEALAKAVPDSEASDIIGGEVGFSIAAALVLGGSSVAIGSIAIGMGARDAAGLK